MNDNGLNSFASINNEASNPFPELIFWNFYLKS